MSATLIRFIPRNLESSYVEVLAYTAGAWSFACATLWPNEQFDDEEVQLAKQFIERHFADSSNRQKALVYFVQRMLLAKQYYNSKGVTQLPPPAEWFNPTNASGYVDTKTMLVQVNERRKSHEQYLRHLAIVAKYYLQYIQGPCEKVFNSCRKRLTRMKVPCALQLFNNAILHYHYVKQ